MYRGRTFAGLVFVSLVSCSSLESTEAINIITQKQSGAGMDALLDGQLFLNEHCLRIGNKTDSNAAIWPTGYSYSTTAEAVLIHNASGQTVVRVGETLRVGGGEVPQPSAEVFAQNYLGEGPCAGKHWVISSVEPIAP